MKKYKILMISIGISFAIFWIFLKPPSPFNLFWNSLYGTLLGMDTNITESTIRIFF